MASLDDLFIAHLGPSMAKHRALAEATAGLPCAVDLAAGEARFNERFRFRVQPLGRENLHEGTWRWSWAERPPLPRRVTEAARRLQAYGASHGLDLFTHPTFDTEALGGDEVALLACGLLDAEGFLIAEQEEDAFYLLVPSLEGQVPAEHSPSFVAEVATEMIESYDLPDHRAALAGLLAYEGYTVDSEDSRSWVALHPTGHEITLTFDELGRLSRFSTREG